MERKEKEEGRNGKKIIEKKEERIGECERQENKEGRMKEREISEDNDKEVEERKTEVRMGERK